MLGISYSKIFLQILRPYRVNPMQHPWKKILSFHINCNKKSKNNDSPKTQNESLTQASFSILAAVSTVFICHVSLLNPRYSASLLVKNVILNEMKRKLLSNGNLSPSSLLSRAIVTTQQLLSFPLTISLVNVTKSVSCGFGHIY